jgi:hypothetical protein
MRREGHAAPLGEIRNGCSVLIGKSSKVSTWRTETDGRAILHWILKKLFGKI